MTIEQITPEEEVRLRLAAGISPSTPTEYMLRHIPLWVKMSILRRNSGVGFNPMSLFRGVEHGAWYDPSDLSTLFQDAAGTIPVTGMGDPVGLMRDKSGNGNHVTQAVSAARPAYRTDGILHWLDFDGVDDCLVRGDTPTLRQSVMDFGVAGMSRTNKRHDYISCGDSNTFLANNWIIQTGLSAVNILPRSPAARQRLGVNTVGVPFVVSASSNGVSVSGRVNMGEDYTITGYLGTDDMTGLAIGASQHVATTPKHHLNGRIYGVILTAQTNLEPSLRWYVVKYLATKSGVIL